VPTLHLEAVSSLLEDAMKTYKPRPDQIEAVMQQRDCTRDAAVAVCRSNFSAWRDQLRKWRSVTTYSGGYFVVEDR